MAKISIEPSKAKSILGQQDSLERALKALAQDVEGVRSGLRYKIAGQEQISQRLREAAEQITQESQSTFSMRSGLEEIIALYEQSENNNRDRVAAEKVSIQEGQAQTAEDGGAHEASWWEKLFDFLFSPVEQSGKIDNPCLQYLPLIFGLPPVHYYSFEKGVLGPTINWNMGDALKDKPGFKQFDDFKNAHQTSLKDRKMFIERGSNMMTLVDPNNTQQMEEFKKHNKSAVPVDVKLIGIGASGSASWYKNENFLDNDDLLGLNGLLKSDGSLSLSEFEGHASAYIGSMGVGVALGASYTAFSAEEMLSFGTDNAQMYLKGGVDVGRVGAQGSANFSLIDANRHWNPKAYVNLSAEAIAGEVSGSVGGKVLGTDVAVTGSVNYGLGAHANVGIHDGKISVDLGVTVGVGGSVKLDIDVSDTFEAFGQGISDVVSGTGEFFGALFG